MLVPQIAVADPVVVAPARFTPSADLDGLYVWLGPVGAAARIDDRWDSTIGGDVSILRVDEAAPVSVVGGSLGGSRWGARGGGRVWLDGVVGTHLAGRPLGVTLGPVVELSDVAHPRLGGAVGVWGFLGITPYARLGYVDRLGGFVEVGLHIALPVWRR